MGKKYEIRFIYHTLHTNKFQIDWKSKCEKENKTIQQLEENMGKFFFNLGVGKGFATMNKNSEEILKMDMIKNRKMTKNG